MSSTIGLVVMCLTPVKNMTPVDASGKLMPRFNDTARSPFPVFRGAISVVSKWKIYILGSNTANQLVCTVYKGKAATADTLNLNSISIITKYMW